jgi:hypothetical protein
MVMIVKVARRAVSRKFKIGNCECKRISRLQPPNAQVKSASKAANDRS